MFKTKGFLCCNTIHYYTRNVPLNHNSTSTAQALTKALPIVSCLPLPGPRLWCLTRATHRLYKKFAVNTKCISGNKTHFRMQNFSSEFETLNSEWCIQYQQPIRCSHSPSRLLHGCSTSILTLSLILKLTLTVNRCYK